MIGLINIQFAVYGDEELYVIEANPRASRTVPFVSKAIGVPLAKLACRLMLGERLGRHGRSTSRGAPRHVSVKEAVLPFGRFPRADSLLGPGDEVDRRGDGRRRRLPGRVRQGAGRGRARSCPRAGAVFIIGHRRRQAGGHPARRPRFHDLGFKMLATGGTAQAIRRMGVPVERIPKISEGSPNVVDRIEAGDVDLVINTPTGSGARADGYEIRRAAWRAASRASRR